MFAQSPEGDLATESYQYWKGKVDAQHRHSDDVWFKRYAHEIVELVPQGGHLIDVGCGSCQVTAFLADSFETICAFDSSESMVEAARGRLAGRGVSNVTVETGRATNFPPSSPRADVILAYGVIQYLDNDALWAHLAECSRFLLPGGVILWGLVPNANLQWLWYIGALTNPRPTYWQMLRRGLSMVRRFLRTSGMNGLHRDGIGRWFTQADIGSICGRAGFDVEFRNCWHYEYRFHACLTRRSEAEITARIDEAVNADP